MHRNHNDAPHAGDISFDALAEPFLLHLDTIASNGGDPRAIPTGFKDLDDAAQGGLHPGNMVAIGAGPGVGATTLALDFVRSASIVHGNTSLVFAPQMTRNEMLMKMLSAECKIRTTDMRDARMTDEDWTRLARRLSEISDAPIVIDDSPTTTMHGIETTARDMKDQGNLHLVVVDCVQLLRANGKRAETRYQEVAEFSRGLKSLARELDVPVLVVSQLNRGPAQRGDYVPQLPDLRDSGTLEDDSDMVILVHRPDAIDQQHSRMGEADLILAKHRIGPTTTVTVAHQLHYSRFVDMAQE